MTMSNERQFPVMREPRGAEPTEPHPTTIPWSVALRAIGTITS